MYAEQLVLSLLSGSQKDRLVCLPLTLESESRVFASKVPPKVCNEYDTHYASVKWCSDDRSLVSLEKEANTSPIIANPHEPVESNPLSKVLFSRASDGYILQHRPAQDRCCA